MEEKELDLDLDFSDLIYDYENRVPCGAASGRPLPQQQIVQADEQCSPLQEKSFSLDGWCAIMPSRGYIYAKEKTKEEKLLDLMAAHLGCVHTATKE